VLKRGEIYFAQLNPVLGSEQGGFRPVVIVQNDVGNLHSPTTIVAAITGKIGKSKLPTHVSLPAPAYGLERDSIVLTEQVRTIDKSRIKQYVSQLDDEKLKEMDQALLISFGLISF